MKLMKKNERNEDDIRINKDLDNMKIYIKDLIQSLFDFLRKIIYLIIVIIRNMIFLIIKFQKNRII